jgi:hypothetical protein
MLQLTVTIRVHSNSGLESSALLHRAFVTSSAAHAIESWTIHEIERIEPEEPRFKLTELGERAIEAAG